MSGPPNLDRRTWLAGAGAAMLVAAGPADAAEPRLTVAFTLPGEPTDIVFVDPEDGSPETFLAHNAPKR